MAQQHADKSRYSTHDTSAQMKSKSHGSSGVDDFDPLSITNGGDEGVFEDDVILESSESQTDLGNDAQSNRSAGASSGMSTDKLSQGLNDSMQNMGKTLDSAKTKLSSQFETLRDGVKSKASQMGTSAKAGASVARDSLKKGAATADVQIRANPYLFAVAAIGVGFAIGRFLPSPTGYKANSSAL